MGLQDSVTEEPATADDRVSIINNLWQNNVQISPKRSTIWNAFFTYYTDECKTALEGSGGYTTVRTHQDIVDIANKLENGCTRSELGRSLVALYLHKRQDDELRKMTEGSIRLAVRLVAMVDIGPISPNCVQGHTPLDWSDKQQDLKTLLRKHFVKKNSVADSSKFGRLFNALNIRRYAGLKIQWTNNLNNHLRLVDDDTTLCVFHHVTFLKGQDR